MSSALMVVNPDNPAELGYPATLPIEVALQTASVKTICQAYGLTEQDWDDLRKSKRFQNDVKKAQEMLREEGMSFKMKARLQAEELLKTSWRMIHAPEDVVPPNVKADLLKFTVRCAGYEADAKKSADNTANMQININLG